MTKNNDGERDRAEISPIPVTIEVDEVRLKGVLSPPRNRRTTITVFAHGSGSSRLSPRNVYVAHILQRAGFGTLLFDLLTSEEDSYHENRFNIDLLSERLAGASRWLLTRQKDSQSRRLVYFAASTGTAAALRAAVDVPEVQAIVSRGGRPDLAMDFLPRVKAPTLLLVGGLDDQVIKLNEEALARLPATTMKELVVVPGASHLFEEPGKLEEVARLATEWFLRFD